METAQERPPYTVVGIMGGHLFHMQLIWDTLVDCIAHDSPHTAT